MTDRARQISDLFQAALERPPEERQTFLRRACGGDENVKREVESLLHYEERSRSFLETPAAAVVPPSPDAAATTMLDRTLGPYRILALLGAGGMGEVYRAHDTQLGRDVAIKVLPAHFTHDAERRARFAREARLLATLNHPHIGAIYGLLEADAATALVLELVEGPTLADRLRRGPLPTPQALAVARQIAEALEAAHDKGIVHRDLKPANIVLCRDADGGGSHAEVRIKVLDFGLAKPLDPSVVESTGQPTGSFDGTVDGRILGTPAYMSPEQARGQAVDRRVDIWAFGCVLFEMLTGKPPFEGVTAPDVFARILEHDPDWSLMPGGTPHAVRTLVERCLRKDHRKRLRDAGDIRIELEELGHAAGDTQVAQGALPARPTSGRLATVMASSLAVLLMAILVLYWKQPGPAPGQRIEFDVSPPENARFTGPAPEFAISPDGRSVAFTATSGGVSALWVRSLDSTAMRQLPGTEGARSPFWKPDSRAVAFFASNQLKTVQVSGGSPMVICAAAHSEDAAVVGGAWNRNDVIVFGRGDDPLWQVSALQANDTPRPLTTRGESDVAHRWPFFLPDGDRFVYLAQKVGSDELRIGSLSGRETITLGDHDSNAVYADHHLFFVRGGNLIAQRFDLDTLQATGEARHVGASVGVDVPYQRGMFSVSATGQVAYSATARTVSQLTWVNRRGVPDRVVGPRGHFFNLDISPDDSRVAVSRMIGQPPARAQYDIWVLDLVGGAEPRRLTDDPGWEFDPSWSPDGNSIAFNSNRPHPPKSLYGLYVRRSDASGRDVPLAERAAGELMAPDWSSNGTIAYEAAERLGSKDVWTLQPSGKNPATVFLATRYDEEDPVFAPGGRWIAYVSNETGRPEVHVRPFPAREGVGEVISREGGVQPRWRADGRELFFVALDGGMMVVPFDPATGRRSGIPQLLFSTQLRPGHNRSYDVARDGQRFLMPLMERGAPITVRLNWRSNGGDVPR